MPLLRQPLAANDICFQQYIYILFFSEMTRMRNLVILKLLLRPWELSHRGGRQKIMVMSREEMSVRVWKGGFMGNLLLHSIVRPNVLFDIW